MTHFFNFYTRTSVYICYGNDETFYFHCPQNPMADKCFSSTCEMVDFLEKIYLSLGIEKIDVSADNEWIMSGILEEFSARELNAQDVKFFQTLFKKWKEGKKYDNNAN